MRKEWTKLAVTKDHSLGGLLLIACRHLAGNDQQQPEQQQKYAELAVNYKLFCIRVLNETISAETKALISDTTIASVVMLACDEVSKFEH